MNNKYKILIIEGENNTNNLITGLLEENGYQSISANSYKNGQMMFTSHRPDLVILDPVLPDADGMGLLGEIRKASGIPVIILSARTSEKDKVEALDSGANDYITKPFGTAELMARVRVALRNFRHGIEEGRIYGRKYQSCGLTIDYDARRVFINEYEIKLTQTEYNILALLSEHAGKVLTYSSIIKSIWGYVDTGSSKKLQVNMSNIRKKIDEKAEYSNYIVNQPGVGYRIIEEDL